MSTNGHTTFGHVLRRERRQAGLTQEMLAERAGISVRAITDLERGVNRAPRRDTLELLADALEVSEATRLEWERLRQYLAVRSTQVTLATPNTVSTHRTNIPAPLDVLIGRDEVLADFRSLLLTSRVVTLTGAGGIGKTQLALALARSVTSDFADGAWLVELAAIRDPALVLLSIARVVGVRPAGETLLVDAMIAYLRERQLLLVLDNFEQIVDAAPQISNLLEHAPTLTVLITSRGRLGLRGENVREVPPLDTPATSATDHATIQRSPAVQLFVERARATGRSLEPTVDELLTIARICRRLGGLPLAIELAASRYSVLSLPAIENRLNRSLSLLTSGRRDVPARQQTQRATIEWSFDLLGSVEKQLFRQMAVFSGGWTLEAMEDVIHLTSDENTELLDTLMSLVECQLVTLQSHRDGDNRFGMLETIREFALEQLSKSGELDDLRLRHADYFIAVAESLEPLLAESELISALELCEREHDNFRSAIDWLVAIQDTERGLRLAGSLGMFWAYHAHFTEGQRQFERLLRLPTTAVRQATLAKALAGAGTMAEWLEHDDRAFAYAEAALAIWRQLPVHEQHGISFAISTLGHMLMRRGEFALAETTADEMLLTARATDDGYGVRLALVLKGVVMGNRGVLDDSRRCFEECLDLSRQVGDQLHISVTLINLAVLEQINDRYDLARPMLDEGVEIQRRLGDKAHLVNSLHNLAENVRRAGDLAAAEAYLIEALTLAREVGRQSEAGNILSTLGVIERQKGELDRSLESFRKGFRLSRPLRPTVELAAQLADLAQLRLDRGEPLLAVKMLAAADTLYDTIGAERWPDAQRFKDEMIATARIQLPPEVVEAEWHAARATPLDQIVDEIVAG